MKFIPKLFIFLLSPLLFLPAPISAQVTDPFQSNVTITPETLHAGESGTLEINFLIPPKHIMYRDKMGLSLKVPNEGTFELGPLQFPDSIKKKDPFTGQDEDIYQDSVTLHAPIKVNAKAASGEQSLNLVLNYQGCSDQLCFRYMKKDVGLSVTIEGQNTNSASSTWKSNPLNALQGHGLLVMLLLTFLGGVGSAFTPCVLPIIPITLAFIGIRKSEAKIFQNFILSLFLVLSMSLTYAMLGFLAAVFGKSLGFLFQNPYFLLFGVALYVFFALSLFGLFEIQVPFALRNSLAKLGGTGLWGSILAGFTVGFLAAPCIGPLIASLLLYVAQDRNLAKGFLLLFSYGLGMGSIFLLIGTFYHRLASQIHGGPYMVWIKRVFAVLLLIPAFYYGSIAYGHFKGGESKQSVSTFWIYDAEEGFTKAKAENKPIFMDFFASWCFPCVEMEKGTFSDPELQAWMKENFVPIKIDCTEETPQCKKYVEKYAVIGWPTFLIINSEGEVKESFIGQKLGPKELRELLKEKVDAK